MTMKMSSSGRFLCPFVDLIEANPIILSNIRFYLNGSVNKQRKRTYAMHPPPRHSDSKCRVTGSWIVVGTLSPMFLEDDSSPCGVMCNLWWTKQHWGKCSQYVCFSCQFSFHILLHTHMIIFHPGLIRMQ
jgi:hypothetical protein